MIVFDGEIRDDPDSASGPSADHSPASAPLKGFTSEAAVAYRGRTAGTADLATRFPAVLGCTVAEGQELRYAVFPEWLEGRTDVLEGFAADAVALDLVFSDGTRLSSLEPKDQYGVPVEPLAQHEGKILHPDQWNLVRVSLDRAAGRVVAGVELRFARTLADPVFAGGWLDSVEIRDVDPEPARPVLWARTRQGTMSGPGLSRGNTLPAVGLPNGFVTGIPVTNATSFGWPYTWHADNRSDNRPKIQAFATSHLPSPWMGERGAFQIMPSTAEGVPPLTPTERALGFDHSREQAHPHAYAVRLDGGIEVEITAAEHTVVARFRFPEGATVGTIVFDQIAGRGALQLPPVDPDRGDGVVTAYTDDALDQRGDRAATPRAFLSAHIDRPVVGIGRAESEERPARGWVRVRLGADRTVVVRLGTSFIGTAQAAFNVHDDGADDTFEVVRDRAASTWDAWLGRIRVDGATPEQRAQLATALYRVGMFPRRAHENVRDASGSTKPHYASPFHQVTEGTAVSTGSRVLAGELSVDNGFWDVYRTAWPLYTLLDPERASRLLDGFAEHYRAGGWTSRWAAPGPIDSMTGTSNDVVFAYAADAGVPVRLDAAARVLSLWDAYDSALRNATVPPPTPLVGRKGIADSQFRGWTDTTVVEGLGWSLDGSVSDLAVAALASALLSRVDPEHPRREELETAREYFSARAGNHRNVFDVRTGFYAGRRADGRFRLEPAEFDPAVWGHDYTETNGWGTAFTAPHDGAGLAAMLGGRAALADRLERFLDTPERGDDTVHGSYPGVIHEMVEARNQRLGMLAISNQPAHHIPFMAVFAGRPDIVQDIVRTAVERLFTGGEIGQGWPGDEDNGEMGAWWIFAMLGLYPLLPTRAGYVLTAPLLPRAVVRLGDDAELLVDAPLADRTHRYIRAVTIDDEPWTSTFVPHARLAGGARIRIDLATSPQEWGRDPEDEPPSLTPDGLPTRLRDVTPRRSKAISGWGDPDVVLDDSSLGGMLVLPPGGAVTLDFAEEVVPSFSTMTFVEPGTHAWRWEAELDGGWEVVDRRREDFRWARQTRPFPLHSRGGTRWRLIAESPLKLAQIELLEWWR